MINTSGSLQYRPEASTEISNLFLASDYVKTHTDVACMEAANEAARRAVNALLDRARCARPSGLCRNPKRFSRSWSMTGSDSSWDYLMQHSLCQQFQEPKSRLTTQPSQRPGFSTLIALYPPAATCLSLDGRQRGGRFRLDPSILCRKPGTLQSRRKRAVPPNRHRIRQGP